MQTIKTIDELFYCELGKKIRHAREQLQMTQKVLSKKVGCSRSLITDYENGYTKIKPYKWKLLCDSLNIKPDINVEIILNKND